jgi:hypothetical protein
MADCPNAVFRHLATVLTAAWWLNGAQPASAAPLARLVCDDRGHESGVTAAERSTTEKPDHVVTIEDQDTAEVWASVNSFSHHPTRRNTTEVFRILDEVLAVWTSHPPGVVTGIVDAIGEHHVAGGRTYVVRLFHTDPALPSGGFVAASAALALGRLGGTVSLNELVRAESWANDSLLASVAVALGQLDDQHAVPALESLAQRDSGEVRARALSALAVFCSPSSVAVVLRNLTDPQDRVRNGAAWWLGQCGRTEQGPNLAALLDDPDSLVRGNALKGLIRIRGREGCEQVSKLSNDESPTIRALADDYAAICGIH